MATTKVQLNSGSFSYEDGTTKVTGSLTVNDKDIQNINGQVNSGETRLGSFDAWKDTDLQFNLHPASISVAGELASAVQAAVTAVEGKL